jgi:hypothetical protein
MASKPSARLSLRGASPSPVTPAPLPEAEQRLRAAFPEIWERYEWLVATRATDRRQRAHIGILVSRPRTSS